MSRNDYYNLIIINITVTISSLVTVLSFKIVLSILIIAIVFCLFAQTVLNAVVRILTFVMGGSRQLTLYKANHSTLLNTDYSQLAQISISDSSQVATSLNNVIAYRPRFSDYHNSNLAGVFINLEGVFPCLEQVTNYNPICRVFTNEEDGFRNGKALINTADSGNDFRIFSSSSHIPTYGLAIQGCPEFNTTCFPNYHAFSVVCYLPRASCSP